MAIERMKKLTILFSSQEAERFEEWLYSRAALHLVNLEREFSKFSASAHPLPYDEQEAVEKLMKTEALLAESDAIAKSRNSFIDSLLPVKAIVRREELDETLHTMRLEDLHAEVMEHSRGIRECRAKLALLARERHHLSHFTFLTVSITELRKLLRTFCFIAEGSPVRMENVSRDRDAAGLLAWEVRMRRPELLTVIFAGRKKDAQKCADIVRAHGFHILDYPDLPVDVTDRMEQIDREEEKAHAELAAHQESLRSLLLPETVRKLQCLKGHWESEKRRAEKARTMLCSKRVGVAKGYVKGADADRFIADMEKEFPGASVIADEPTPGDAVPVSIRLSRLTRPAQLLINMFGLPNYFAIDPTPFLMLTFLIFFGICFADVFYGFLLILFSRILIKRYQKQENLREFFRLFLYCGVSTVIFGVLTGSWAADIYKPEYLGQNNILQRFVEKTTILDMMAKPVIALVISLVIGVVNQLYGIVVRIIQDMRQRNWRGALFDGVFWLVYLVGLLLFALSALSGIGGSALKYASLTAVIGGGIGLILTQGRDQGSLAGRFIFGVVSLYGIVGGYGTVSFIGDVLSYSRLLALGLTTAIVGMSFNIIATLIPQIICSLFPFLSPVVKFPVVAGAIIVSVMVFGHLFNFILSILSAFVHSGRLILLEWFGRFYQGGGEWFQPHGFTSDTVEIVRK